MMVTGSQQWMIIGRLRPGLSVFSRLTYCSISPVRSFGPSLNSIYHPSELSHAAATGPRFDLWWRYTGYIQWSVKWLPCQTSGDMWSAVGQVCTGSVSSV